MAKNCAYLVVYFHDGRYYPASRPFYIDEQGITQYFEADEQKTETIHLKRKYHERRVSEWCNRIVGGRFQLANRADFSDAMEVYKIDSVPEAMYNTIQVDLPKAYRFFRYLSPNGSPGDMAELELYNENNEQLFGQVIGTASSFYFFEMSDKYKAFDGDVLSFFEAEEWENVWVGVKFTQKEKIGKIVFLPRNDDNFIREDELYELFYWHSSGHWVSLGQQKGKKLDQVLIYEAPSKALFRLRNLDKGVEERIFTYEKGKQVWW